MLAWLSLCTMPMLCFADAYYDFAKLGLPAPFVNKAHIDLSQFGNDANIKYRVIRQISKFRSSAGHDSSDAVESCRSMKHYFGFPSATTKIYSPITGTIIAFHTDGNGQNGQIAITIVPDGYPAFWFTLYHVVPTIPISPNITRVVEGQQIGIAFENEGADLAVSIALPPGSPNVKPDMIPMKAVSFFDLLTDAGFAPYKALGFSSPQDFIISQAERDANPLTCPGGEGTYPTNAVTDPLPAYVYVSDGNMLQVNNGWNLLGNSWAMTWDVAKLFGDSTKIISVWAWNNGGWAFYSPSMTPADLSAYLATKGYQALTTISYGQAFWVNASQPASIPVVIEENTANYQSFWLMPLTCGWALHAVGDNATPKGLKATALAPPAGLGIASSTFSTLWTWDNPTSRWYFYSPGLDGQGGTALSDYVSAKGYLPAANMILGSGVGFWVNNQCQ